MSLRDAARTGYRLLPRPVAAALRDARHPLAWRDRRKRRAALLPFLSTVGAYCGGFRGKRVLEVGSDGEGLLIQEIQSRFGAAEVIGVNPAFLPAAFGASCRLEAVDVRRTPYPDDWFDLIASSSAFEHIHELDRALLEMHRILRPGGHLYSHFGPIWSTSYGHHLWVNHRGRLFNYWNTNLPPYCHLLMTRDSLAEHCCRTLEAGAAEVIAAYVFSSTEQNRLMYADYVRCFRESPFEVCFLKGYDHPELAARHLSDRMDVLLDRLRRQYPDAGDFLYDGITVLLRKRGGAEAPAEVSR